MLQSDPERFVSRTLLDPADFGRIVIQDCRGKRGFPVIEQSAFIDEIEEYPEVYDRLKDAVVGLINAFYERNLIKPTDLLHINEILDTKEEMIAELQEQIKKLKRDSQQNIDTHDENSMEWYDDEIKRLKNKVNHIIEEREEYKEIAEEYETAYNNSKNKFQEIYE